LWDADHQFPRTAYVPNCSRLRSCSGWLRVLQGDEEAGYFVCNREAARSAERVDGKAARQHSRRGGACSGSRLGVVRRVSDHHRLGGGKAQLPQRHTHNAGIRLAVFDIVTARHCLDKVIDVQERQVVLQLGAFAVGRKSDPTAAQRERLKNLAHAAESFHAVKVFCFVDLCTGLEDLLSLGSLKVRSDNLKGLVPVEARVQLQGCIRNLEAGLLKRFLKAAEVLRHAVNKGALNIENIAREHIDLAGRKNTSSDYIAREWNRFLTLPSTPLSKGEGMLVSPLTAAALRVEPQELPAVGLGRELGIMGADKHAKDKDRGAAKFFGELANRTAQAAGRASTFMLAAAVVIVWAVTGPLFGFSDTWQLVINTGTTIVTFLMVFLIQNSQNRGGSAIQVKLDELIRVGSARNSLVGIEHLTDEELEDLRKKCEARAKTEKASVNSPHGQ